MKCLLCRLLIGTIAAVVVNAGPLLTSITVDQPNQSTWAYSIFNNEPLGSDNYIQSFELSVSAPITVVSSPAGWAVDTNGSSFVFWYNTDFGEPYPNDIAPGGSLNGFVLSATGAISTSQLISVYAWDHLSDLPGSAYNGLVAAPSNSPGSTSTPEPMTFAMALMCFVPTAVGYIRRHRRVALLKAL